MLVILQLHTVNALLSSVKTMKCFVVISMKKQPKVVFSIWNTWEPITFISQTNLSRIKTAFLVIIWHLLLTKKEKTYILSNILFCSFASFLPFGNSMSTILHKAKSNFFNQIIKSNNSININRKIKTFLL